MDHFGLSRVTVGKETPIDSKQLLLLCELGVPECEIPLTMHEACDMIDCILDERCVPRVPPSDDLLLFLLNNGIAEVPKTQDDAMRMAKMVEMSHTKFESICNGMNIMWNPANNKLIPPILRACYKHFGWIFPESWWDAVHNIGTLTVMTQFSIIPLCIERVLYEAHVVEKQAMDLATDTCLAQCLQQEYERSAQIHSDAQIARRLSTGM